MMGNAKVALLSATNNRVNHSLMANYYWGSLLLRSNDDYCNAVNVVMGAGPSVPPCVPDSIEDNVQRVSHNYRCHGVRKTGR